MKKYRKEWTERENALLAEYYHTLSQDALFAILPGRSIPDMAAQAVILKRKNVKFKEKA